MRMRFCPIHADARSSRLLSDADIGWGLAGLKIDIGLILWTMYSTFHFIIYLCLGVSSYDRVTIEWLYISVYYYVLRCGIPHTHIFVAACKIYSSDDRWLGAGNWWKSYVWNRWNFKIVSDWPSNTERFLST